MQWSVNMRVCDIIPARAAIAAVDDWRALPKRRLQGAGLAAGSGVLREAATSNSTHSKTALGFGDGAARATTH